MAGGQGRMGVASAASSTNDLEKEMHPLEPFWLLRVAHGHQ